MSNWWIYQGRGGPQDDILRLPDPPPWRRFDDRPERCAVPAPESLRDIGRATTYRPDADAIDRVNAALYLRRPLLVTGMPGTGKSTLAYSVAHELGLGQVLRWPITSRVTLQDGLYKYDPMGRLYRTSRGRAAAGDGENDDEDMGRYIRLGPLGTALLPHDQPRVLLIDEIDKGDLDLPNDLLTIFEEGEYEITELTRPGGAGEPTEVLTADGTAFAIDGGRVRCSKFPFVVMTSNKEREFPPAFLRRCVQLELPEPKRPALEEIVAAHLGDLVAEADDLIEIFLRRRDEGKLATDQLLNAIYLTNRAEGSGSATRADLAKLVMSQLTGLAADDDES